jgi:hypothetical protein
MDEMVTEISNDRDAVLRLMGMLQILLTKLNESAQAVPKPPALPASMPQDAGHTIKRRQVTPQPDTAHEGQKKSKNVPAMCPQVVRSSHQQAQWPLSTCTCMHRRAMGSAKETARSVFEVPKR